MWKFLGAFFSLNQPETFPFLLPRDCSEVATAFAYVMTDMWLGDSECVSPEIFRSALGNLYPALMKKTQQDAQEFLIYVLNELHEALKKVSRMNGLEIGLTFRSISYFHFSLVCSVDSIYSVELLGSLWGTFKLVFEWVCTYQT